MVPRLDAANSVLLRTGVPEGWGEVSVADLARIVGGGTPDREQPAYWRNGTIPWITPTDLTANNSKYIASGAENISELGLQSSNATLVPPGSIVFSTRGTVGNMAVAANPLTCNQSCEILVPRGDVVGGDFLYYLLNFGLSAFIRLSGGTTFGAITRRDIARVRFAVPRDADEQAAIARILDAVDTALERTRAAVEHARRLRASILVDLLGHGVGVDGKVRHLDSRPNEFVATPIGRLPSPWRLSTVDREFDLQNGFTLNAERRARFKRRRYLRVANVQRDTLDLSDVQELEAGDAEFAPRVLASDDLLVVEGHADRMEIGRCARVTEHAVGMTFQNHLFRLRTRGGVVPAFACLWLNSAYAQRFWNARCATSSGLNTINQRTLKRLIVPVPSEPEQQSIARIVAQQRQHLEALRAKQLTLDALKKGLMDDLLAGRMRVANAIKEAAS
jgi:type I restriction enzyme S subunit